VPRSVGRHGHIRLCKIVPLEQQRGLLVASFTSSSFAELVESRPSINDVSSSRVRCEAGSLVAMGCSFGGLAKVRLLIHIRKGCTPPNSQQV
jgi:hypothetical protein